MVVPPALSNAWVRPGASALLALLLAACTGKCPEPADASLPVAVDAPAAIHVVMAAQEAAWDRGDIDGFMEGYAPDICFIGAEGSTCGRDSVTARYKRRYADRAAMGDLHFGRLEVVQAGPDHAWCTGTWRLERSRDTLGGGFSLLWRRDGAAWRILRDHTY